MRRDVPPVTFEPVRAEDLPVLKQWMGHPHWREWWGDPETELGHIRDLVEGGDTTRPFIFHIGGRPTGYIQYWFIGHHQNEQWTRDNPWLTELPSDAVGVDLSIGEAADLSQGYGSTALAAFAEMLSSRGYRTIIIDPDPRNARAVGAYRKAGFEPYEGLQTNDDVLIMRYSPDGSLL